MSKWDMQNAIRTSCTELFWNKCKTYCFRWLWEIFSVRNFLHLCFTAILCAL